MAELNERQPISDSDCLVLIPAAELHLVGSTSWPLERTSPTLKSGEYAYVFAVKGGTAFYSVLISTGTPDGDHALFEEILSIPEEEASAEAGPSHAGRIAAGTIKVQEAIAKGAVWASQKIMEQSKRWQEEIKPAQPVQISPELKAHIRRGRDLAKKGASVAGRVSQTAADISVRVAESIVRRVGPSAGFGRQLNAGGQRRAEAAQEIAAASLVAAVEIYASMEEAAKTVVASSGQATADLVGHKYGSDAGEVSLHAAQATTHAATAAMRLRTVGIRSIAKRIAKHTSVSFARAAAQPQQRPPPSPMPAAAPAPAGPLSPFAMAPASILPVDPPTQLAPTPSGPLSPFALAQPPTEEAEGKEGADKAK
ncbi:hypothetical protein WJX75_009127 [Coccomyxa subellipsoidea]|uniref:Senescence domain-containing protein n=1 Tax=Coccomyxa subellipsoidea TaxID=248742 RepID=A0ABR2Z1R8_9CHLO